MFPTVRKTDLDMQALGRQITERKRELRRELQRHSSAGRPAAERRSASSQPSRQ